MILMWSRVCVFLIWVVEAGRRLVEEEQVVACCPPYSPAVVDPECAQGRDSRR